MNRITATLLAVVTVATTGNPAARSAVHDPTAARLERELPALIEKAEVTGLQIALIDDKQVVWAKSLGVADAEAGVPVKDTTLFEAASLSKPVFAYIVMKLVDDERLDLDEPLHATLENERLAHDERARRITPRMVLTHSSGLPNWGGTPLELRFDPGSSFGYSGEGYVYLQQVIEKRTGKSLQALAEEFVFQPFGMSRTQYRLLGDEADRARGHDRLGVAGRAASADAPNAAASLVTTASDYGRFVAGVLQGKGLSAQTAELLLRPAVAAGHPFDPGQKADAPMAWALGWGVDGEGEARVLWHWGDNGIFRGFVAVSPHSGRGFVYFANSQHGLTIADAIREIVLGSAGDATRWVGIGAWDDPVLLLRRELLGLFREQGDDALFSRLDALEAEAPEDVTPDLLGSLADLLQGLDANTAAIKLLRRAESKAPNDPEIKSALADALLQAGDYQRALAALQQALAQTESGQQDDIRRRISWVRAYLEADPPTRLDTAALVGSYSGRLIWTDGDRLLYRRGEGATHELRPLSQNVFRVGDFATFRLRFDFDGSEKATSVTGLYINGHSDHSPRDD